MFANNCSGNNANPVSIHCQVENHEDQTCFAVCIEKNCQRNGLLCFKCIQSFHQQHLDSCMAINDFVKLMQVNANQIQINTLGTEQPQTEKSKKKDSLEQLNNAKENLTELKAYVLQRLDVFFNQQIDYIDKKTQQVQDGSLMIALQNNMDRLTQVDQLTYEQINSLFFFFMPMVEKDQYTKNFSFTCNLPNFDPNDDVLIDAKEILKQTKHGLYRIKNLIDSIPYAFSSEENNIEIVEIDKETPPSRQSNVSPGGLTLQQQLIQQQQHLQLSQSQIYHQNNQFQIPSLNNVNKPKVQQVKDIMQNNSNITNNNNNNRKKQQFNQMQQQQPQSYQSLMQLPQQSASISSLQQQQQYQQPPSLQSIPQPVVMQPIRKPIIKEANMAPRLQLRSIEHFCDSLEVFYLNTWCISFKVLTENLAINGFNHFPIFVYSNSYSTSLTKAELEIIIIESNKVGNGKKLYSQKYQFAKSNQSISTQPVDSPWYQQVVLNQNFKLWKNYTYTLIIVNTTNEQFEDPNKRLFFSFGDTIRSPEKQETKQNTQQHIEYVQSNINGIQDLMKNEDAFTLMIQNDRSEEQQLQTDYFIQQLNFNIFEYQSDVGINNSVICENEETIYNNNQLPPSIQQMPKELNFDCSPKNLNYDKNNNINSNNNQLVSTSFLTFNNAANMFQQSSNQNQMTDYLKNGFMGQSGQMITFPMQVNNENNWNINNNSNQNSGLSIMKENQQILNQKIQRKKKNFTTNLNYSYGDKINRIGNNNNNSNNSGNNNEDRNLMGYNPQKKMKKQFEDYLQN